LEFGIWNLEFAPVPRAEEDDMKKLNRREFVETATAAGVAAAAVPGTLFGEAPRGRDARGSEQGRAPTVMTPKSVKPVVISSANGNRYKNGGAKTCVETAFGMITGGSDVLDALIAGVNIVELDPEDSSVGYGGLPNAEGVVQLDSCCMHGPKKRAGGVAEIEGVRTPSKVAQLVMDLTDHHLIVGKGAQDFARSMGFKIEDDLNTEKSRTAWLEWKRRTDPLHYLSPKDRETAYHRVAM
jgi:N4-(beta-N-acetylglucosaminyl)-L-asparaginase